MKYLFAVVIFGLIVLIHEFGHFIVAKMSGVMVEEFSIGFGPRLVSVTRGGTLYALKLLPLGGSCRMKGMMGEEEEDGPEDPEDDSFQSKPVGKRIAIIVAGPLFNFLLAFVAAVVLTSVLGIDLPYITSVTEGSPAEEAGLLVGDELLSINGKSIVLSRDYDAYFQFHALEEGEVLKVRVRRNGEKQTIDVPVSTVNRYMMGISYYADESEATLTAVSKNSAAEAAGLAAGDVITSVDGTAIESGLALNQYMEAHPLSEAALNLTFTRNGKSYETFLTPVMTAYSTPGFVSYTLREKVSSPEVLRYSASEVRFWISTVFSSLKMLFTGDAGVKDLSGPVGVVTVITDVYDEAAEEGTLMIWMNMLYLLILLSANVGVMNLLPIPALDGGRLLFLLIEAITGHKVNEKIEGIITFVGVILLMILMAVVFYNDIARLF